MQKVKTTAAQPALGRFSLFVGGVTQKFPSKSITLQQLHKRVTSGRYAAQTAAIRALRYDSDEQKALKKTFDNVTPAGVFSERMKDGLIARSGFLVLDSDKVRNPRGLAKVLRRDSRLGPSIMFQFISPRLGLKTFVAVDLSIPHDVCYAAVVGHIARKYPNLSKVDQSGKDVSRSCLLCHDPEAYLNSDHETPIPFPLEFDDLFDDSPSPFPRAEGPVKGRAPIERWVEAVEKAGTFPDDYDTWYQTAFAFATLGEDGRALFHRISCVSPRYNERESEKQFDISLRDSRGEIKLGTFVKFCQNAGIQLAEDAESGADPVAAEPPMIPADVYMNLPDVLQRACHPFEGHEKAVMLLGSLGVMSGCFPGVGGVYDGRRYGLNLFCFVVAPAASGKGTMTWAQRLARPWHRHLLERNKKALAQYAADLTEYKAEGRKSSPPTEPPRLLHYLPGDATAAALIEALEENDGRGTVFVTEVLTLITALGGEHGKFADKLCAMFQHEPVSVMRKGNKQLVDLERPALSLVVSGTPAQVPLLMPSAENGLVSRVLFYWFTQPYVWRSVAPKGGPPLEAYFDALADEIFHLIKQTPLPGKDGALEVEITLSTADWARLDVAGANGLADAVNEAGGAGASTAYRLAQVAFRLIGLFTVLRRWEQGEVPAGILEAEPIDVTTALALMEAFRAHALVVLNSLSQKNKNDKVSGGRHAFRTNFEPIVRKMRAQVPPVPYHTIQELTGVPSNTAWRWMKD